MGAKTSPHKMEDGHNVKVEDGVAVVEDARGSLLKDVDPKEAAVRLA